MAYAHGVDAVGELLVNADALGFPVGVPSICLVEAYSLLDHDEYELLGVLRNNPAAMLIGSFDRSDSSADCPIIGRMAQRTGRLGAGHAAYVALVNAAGVITSRPDQIHAALGTGWPTVEV